LKEEEEEEEEEMADEEFVPHNAQPEEPAIPVLEGKQLSYVGAGLTSIPEDLIQKFGSSIESLDLSNNEIAHVKNLGGFANLKNLVLDNNKLESNQEFPKLQYLHTLWANSNDIDDIKSFLDGIATQLPSLTYLSLLKNPACPNYFVGKEQQDYQRYRYYVLYRLPSLKFLDSTPVTEPERKEAKRIGQYMVVVKPSAPTKIQKTDADELPPEKGLPQTLTAPGVGNASYGKSRYVYWGKESEGNRFIVNSQL